MTSFITLDMATLPLKSSHKEQPSAIRFRWAKGLSANAIQSEMRPCSLQCLGEYTKSCGVVATGYVDYRTRDSRLHRRSTQHG